MATEREVVPIIFAGTFTEILVFNRSTRDGSHQP